MLLPRPGPWNVAATVAAAVAAAIAAAVAAVAAAAAAAVAGTVEAVPRAADPPDWPGSCVKVAATGLNPDVRTTSSKADAAVAAAADVSAAAADVAAAAAVAAVDAVTSAAEDAALTWSGNETAPYSQASRLNFLLCLCLS